MSLTLSCAFATSPESPEHARAAESLGYENAYFYDSPALYPDVWVQLCRAAERTTTIGLGPGVLVPSNRHPMTNAAAIATLVEAAGQGRVIVAVGSGFTGRMAMGQRALKWTDVKAYVEALQRLLAGEVVEWEGAAIQMLHSPGMAPPRPIAIRWLIGAGGPKGVAVARELADGVFGATPIPDFDWSVSLLFGTVLEEGESADSERALAAAGHAGAVNLHYAYEHSLMPAEQLQEWLAAYGQVPQQRRHLAMHTGHLVHVNEHDAPAVTGELITSFGLAHDAGGWRERIAQLEQEGATEIAYQPAGPDPVRELEAFAAVARG
ncbi:MAG TPA: LLM class flavin-dependent oxidoreductase [Solirubrobacteraceae bacterium]|nr:LLM class flavin-dependent oxidoreductase [Solirubrobacteraceae bacterium]